jgi:hypothetical protein
MCKFILGIESRKQEKEEDKQEEVGKTRQAVQNVTDP